ncbi:beta strand repeat-containing protein [Dongia sp.]|uniref:beta strand repeat-containing protein n=1 Tax=Dongia sp. TaxID=1977262 RepID=UPI00375343D8
MTGVAPNTESVTPGPESPTAAPALGPDGAANPVPRIVTAQPGQVIQLPFTLATATIALRGADLFLQAGDQLVVIEGYGPALLAGRAPTVLDPRGDTLALDTPEITTGNPVILTDAPEPPPQPAEFSTASVKPPHFGGALLTVFDPVSGSLLRSFRSVGTGGDATGFDGSTRLRGAGSPAPDFDGISLARTSGDTVPSTIGPDPFAAQDDAGGVLRGLGVGNVIAGWGAAPDLTTGGIVTEAAGIGAAIPVTAGGVDVAGQFGTLHIAADGSVGYQRTVGSVTDLAALPNGALDVFIYRLLNGDGRSDTATLSIRVMPETVVAGNATGTGNDEALVLQAGAAGQLSGLGGEDRLFGANGADTLSGGDDDDYLQGGAGDDTLLGGGDNDTLTPGSGNDTADGGAGDDVLDLAGNLTAADTLTGGSGNDVLKLDGNYAAGVTFTATTLSEVERIELKAGNSYKLTLADATNAVTLTVDGKTLTAGNVLTLNGAAETSAALIAAAGAGNDALAGGAGADQLDGGAGNDTLTGNAGADVLTAGAGNDTLSGGAGNDRLVLAGDLTAADKIDGGADSDILELDGDYAAGVTFAATTLTNVETISLAAGNSYKFTLNNANNTAGLTIDGSALAAAHSLTVNGAAETTNALTASGGAGNDVLIGGTAKDILMGNAGDDTLTGNNGDDTLLAGTGTDILAGGNGNDVLDLGAGLDAADKIDGGANADTLRLDGDYGAGVVFNATTVTNVETFLLAAGHDYNLKLTDANNTAGLTVNASALAAGNRLMFDGGAETASLLNATGGAGDDVLIGGSGNDTLTGGAGADQLTSGAGNDTLSGGAGDDVVTLNAGLTAVDKIDGGADFDIVRLDGNYVVGVTLSATTITNVEQIDLIGNSYKLVLNDATATTALKVDGTALIAGQQMIVDGAAETSAALTLLGGAANDTLGGGAGDDLLSGGAGNDTITTGAGIDTVSGGGDNDTIVLAANLTAADTIDGGSGADTVTLSGNYGAGVILGATTITNVETITLANGFSYKLILDDATNAVGLTVNGAALVAANALYLDGSAEAGAALTATGGSGNDTMFGGAGDDVLNGGSGNDLLRAGTGTDTLSGGNGNDSLELGADLSAADKIDGGANTDTLLLDGDYAGLVLTATTVTNVETIQLAAGHDYALTLNNATNAAGLIVDGSALGAADALSLNGAAETTAVLSARGGAGDDTLVGGAGADILQGGTGNDLLISGANVDTLQGGAGDDVLDLGADLLATDKLDGGADNDVLKLSGNYSAGITFTATTLVNVETITLAAGNSYKFTLNDANNTAALAIDGGALAAGQVLTVNGAAETASALLLSGGAGNDALTGGAGSDVIKGGAGNDTLTTGAGNDTVDGGSGNDTIALAANLTALDQIDGGADSDTVTLSGNYSAGVVFAATTLTNVETLTLAAGNSYKLTLDDATNSAGLTVNAAALAATAVLTLDGSAETSAALTATGGAGNDVITGGAGADVITAGGGNDTLSGNAGADSFIFAGNFTAADKIDGGADQDKLSLNGNYAAGVVFAATTLTNVETITVADGNSYKFTLNDATNAAGLSVDGSLLGATRVLTVNGAAETSASLAATGGAGNDVLTGGAGLDVLSGGAGNDVLTTGAGNDVVDGGAGNDTIALAANLTALDQIDGGADTDTLTLSGNYSAGVVLMATTVRNVETITVAAGNNYKLTLDDATNGSGLTVNAAALAAANALTLDGAAELSAALTAIGGAGNDVITGGAGADKITSGAGVDTLNGGAGSDSFTLAANLTAADQINGGADADTLSLNGNYSAGIVFNATTLVNVETITVADGNSYKFTLNDATNAAGLSIDGSLLGATRVLTIDGAAETGASLTATGGNGNDSLTGGGGGDILTGGAGNDTLVGNAGADLLFGGVGNDTITGGADADTFQLRLADIGKDTVKDFKLLEGDVLEFTGVLDGAGSDIQDLIDAGLTAKGSGGNCVITWNGGTSTLTLTGVGGAVNNVNELATLLGGQLHVTHS